MLLPCGFRRLKECFRRAVPFDFWVSQLPQALSGSLRTINRLG
jgi:hypothetical protein